MKIAVLGAGAMGGAVVRDLLNNPALSELLIADAKHERAQLLARSLGDSRVRTALVDGIDVDSTASALRGSQAVVNAAQYEINCDVMRACLKAGTNYCDLGGMYHITRKQHLLFDDFKAAGLTAITGIGAAPGITNVLSRYGYDRLDAVDKVDTSFAAADLNASGGTGALIAPYSIRTIMQELSEDSVQFIAGQHIIKPALSGPLEIDFPQPIGVRTCYHTLHSEPATIPYSFRDKGVKEVTWRLSLPTALEEALRTLVRAGFASTEPMEFAGNSLVPVDVLAAVMARNAARALATADVEAREAACIRSTVYGVNNGSPETITVDCIAQTPSSGESLVALMTGVPASIAVQMLASGSCRKAGVWGPEAAIEPHTFFAELGRRGMKVQVTHRKVLSGGE